MEGSEQFQQQASGHAQLSPGPLDGTNAQTEQAVAGGNYKPMASMSTAHSPCQPTTDSCVGSCSQIEDSHSDDVGVKVSMGEQEAALEETVEHEISTPEFSACNTILKPVLAGAVTQSLNSLPYNMA